MYMHDMATQFVYTVSREYSFTTVIPIELFNYSKYGHNCRSI